VACRLRNAYPCLVMIKKRRAVENPSHRSRQWYAATSRLNDALDYNERVAIIEMLWHVVCVDGALHHLEQSLMRRVARLLHTSPTGIGGRGVGVRVVSD
jgi:uncharacterized tellurite resistance protein B-like protein